MSKPDFKAIVNRASQRHRESAERYNAQPRTNVFMPGDKPTVNPAEDSLNWEQVADNMLD